MYFREKRTLKQIADTMAKYWTSYLRKHVPEHDVVGRAEMKRPLHEAFASGLVGVIREKVEDQLTKESIDEFERVLSDSILNGVEIESKNGTKELKWGLKQCCPGFKGFLSTRMDYDPDKYLRDSLSKVFGEKESSVAYFFPFKTDCRCMFDVPEHEEEVVLSLITVREGHSSKRMELLDDLSQRMVDEVLNYDLLKSKGFEFVANDEAKGTDKEYGYTNGSDWVFMKDVGDLSHSEFQKKYASILS